jgi:cobalt-zinc-cadmium efflux system outer membrane protein
MRASQLISTIAGALAVLGWRSMDSGAQAPAPLTRQDAVASAIARGARLAVARADTSVAYAQILTARALPDPALNASYSKSEPKYHVTVDLPLDYPWLRRTRVGSAEAARLGAQLRFAFERAAAALDADTTYTRALAARAHAELSRRTAMDADSLRRMALVRRDAGDASQLDVELATVTAGQQANVAAADSLTYVSTVLDLQTVIGLAADGVAVMPVDTLVPPAADGEAAAIQSGTPLSIAAAEQSFAAATLSARLQHRSLWGAPSLTFGFETGDAAEPGLLPTVGVALPLPLFSRNRGPIALAEAERERARAELALARVEGAARIARATRERSIALAKVARDRLLVSSANRVAAMSFTAYREGQSSLPNVLEAQRSAREILAQYIDDVASAWIASAVLRVFTLTAPAGTSSAP